MAKSNLQSTKECYVCGIEEGLHEHHIFYGTANRSNSEEYGLKVYLCGYHHNLSNEGVHFNKALDLHLKRIAQEYFESELGTHEDFMRIFGRNYK